MARTKSKPIALPPGAASTRSSSKNEVPAAYEREENSGIHVIPIDDED